MQSPIQAVDRARPGGALRFEVPVRSSRYTVVQLALFAAAGLFLSVMLALSTAGVWSTPEDLPRPPIAARAALLAGMIAATAFLGWRLAWNLRGREVWELDGGRLRIRREVSGLARTRTFDLNRMRNLRVGSFRDQPLVYASWGRPFVGKGDAYIVFEHDGKSHFYGRGMDGGEARKMVVAVQEAGSRG